MPVRLLISAIVAFPIITLPIGVFSILNLPYHISGALYGYHSAADDDAVPGHKMSLDLGHSKGYIQGISSGKAFPSVPELFYICEYLGVTLQEFFSPEIHDPQLVNELYSLAKNLDAEDLQVLIDTAKRLGKNH